MDGAVASDCIGPIVHAGIVVGFGNESLRVETVPAHVTRAMMHAWHYSHRWVNNARINLGVYAGRDLMGGMQWGYALNPNSGGNLVAGTGNREYLELNRLWLHGSLPRFTGSRVMRMALKYIRIAHPEVQWVMSFADERCKRFGAIYQACNYLYLGEHTAVVWELDGEWFHKIDVTARRGKEGSRGVRIRGRLHEATVHRFRQFRYIRFLHRSARKRLRLPVLPYPKPNAGEADDGTAPGHQPGGGGSTPSARSNPGGAV